MSGDVVSLIAKLNLPVADADGFCHGIAIMSERARVYGEYDKFVARMEYINRLDANTIQSQLDELQKHLLKLKNNTTDILLSEDEKILLTIQTFLFQIVAYQNPAAIQQFLNTKDKFYAFFDSTKIEEIMYEEKSESIICSSSDFI